MLGLYAFFYACLHFVVYVFWDQSGNIGKAFAEILNRRYLQIGYISLMMMVPLAATSTNGMIKRMGAKRWKQLHWLAYPAAVLGVIHYWMEVKADIRLPAAFGVALAVLFLYRVLEKRFPILRRSAAARKPTAVVSRAAEI